MAAAAPALPKRITPHPEASGCKGRSSSVGPNGVTVSDGTVYGATNDSVFALQAN